MTTNGSEHAVFNGMAVGFVGSLIWGRLRTAFVQGGLQTDWLDSGQLPYKALLPGAILHLALGRRVLSHPSTPRVSYLYSALACLFDDIWSAGRALRAFP